MEVPPPVGPPSSSDGASAPQDAETPARLRALVDELHNLTTATDLVAAPLVPRAARPGEGDAHRATASPREWVVGYGQGVVAGGDGPGAFVRDVTRRPADDAGRPDREDALRASEDALRALNASLETRVAERTAQVVELASSLTLAEQRERHRVAQVLHDDLQQLLFGALVQIRLAERALEERAPHALDEAVGPPPLAKLNEVIQRAITVTRSLTVDLSPPVLAGEGLLEALEWLRERMIDAYGLYVDVDGEAVRVPMEEMRILLFQLVRELLFNVVKHAGVREARVTVGEQDGAVFVRIEDEGRGFDPTPPRPDAPYAGTGHGLSGIADRLGLFGGRLDVESAPGRGTRVTIRVPALSPRP